MTVLDSALRNAKVAGSRRLTFAAFSSELLDITRNFVCSYLASVAHTTSRKPGHGGWLVLVSLDGTCSGLREALGGSARIQCIDVYTSIEPPRATQTVQYGAARYLFIVKRKLVLFNMVIEAASSHGFEWVLFSDVDVVFKDDAFHHFLNKYTGPAAAASARSLVFMDESPYDGHCNACAGCRINSGFFFAKVDKTASAMLRQALVNLEAGKTYDKGDQGAIQQALEDLKLEYGLLPCDSFANGNVFLAHPELIHTPIGFHANWIASSSVKFDCLHKSGNWYVDSASGSSCRTPVPKTPPLKWTVRARPYVHEGKYVKAGQVTECLPWIGMQIL